MHETPTVLACPDGVAVVESYPLLGDPIHMTLTLIIVAAIAVIWLVERSVEHLELAVAGLCFGVAVRRYRFRKSDSAIICPDGGNLRSVKRQV
jgi:hypothetical protein